MIMQSFRIGSGKPLLLVHGRLTDGTLGALVREVAPGAQPGQETGAASTWATGWQDAGALGLVGLGVALTAVVAFLVGVTTTPSSPRHGTARDALLPPPGRGLRVRPARRPEAAVRALAAS